MDENKIREISKNLSNVLTDEFKQIANDPVELTMLSLAYIEILNTVTSLVEKKHIPAFLRITANAIELAQQEIDRHKL